MKESRADVALAEAARAKGMRVSSGQVREWRQLDVLPPTTVRHLGRGRGAEASYPDGALDAAVSFASALAEDRNLDRAVLRSFVRGVAVGEKAVRRAYFHVYRETADELGLAKVTGWRPRRSGGRPTPASEQRRAHVRAGFLAIVSGQQLDYTPTRAVLDHLGLTMAPTIPGTYRMLEQVVSLAAWANVAQTAPLIELSAGAAGIREALEALWPRESEPQHPTWPGFDQAQVADDYTVAFLAPAGILLARFMGLPEVNSLSQ